MHPARTRRSTTIAITGAAIALALGTAAPAWADPGNGNANGAANGNGGSSPSQPPGQAKQDPTPNAASTAPAPKPTHTHAAPGQAKKATTAPKGKNDNNAGGNGKGKATGTTHVAPGQAKKAASGTGNAGGHGKGKGANGPAGHNPPGNNGTVKIHALPGDPGHHNVPHPGCSFAVDFWGFDAGQTLNVSFTGQAPTGPGTPLTLSGSGTSITSPDDAGGGNDPDGELVFTPTASELSVLGAPAKQGYHVRLTVATGQGGGQKQKVFWISPCAQNTPVTQIPDEGPTLTADSQAATTRSNAMTAVGNTPVFSLPELKSAPVTRASDRVNQASRPLASLPFTGANLSTLIASGVLALLIGTAITLAVRRRHQVG